MATVTGASPAPRCPVCSGPIPPIDRPPTALLRHSLPHRARRQAGEAAEHLAWIRRLAADVGRARQLADILAVAAAVVDGPTAEPSTGWEGELAMLAQRLQVLAGQIAGADRDHERTVARYRHSTRIAGTAPQIRRAPSSTAVDDETLCGRAAGAHAS